MLIRLTKGPREHDYTENMWGHALHGPELVELTEPPKSLFEKWFRPPVKIQVLQALGHGDVREGDTILLKMESGKVARFLVREIEHFRDPDDMFKIERADFVEYVAEPGRTEQCAS